MNKISQYIRYNSRFRARLYKTLKLLDKFTPYRRLYDKRIRSIAANLNRFPNELSIETINSCNARCVMCPHPTMERAHARMDDKLAYSLIDQAAEANLSRFYLSGFGEPLLDKRLPDFVSYAKHKGIADIVIVTNGSLLTPEKARALVDAGLNEINISMDGFTPETYEKIRSRLKFNTLVENIKGISVLVNRGKVKIIITCVDLIHNRKERKQAFQLLGKYVDKIYFRQAQGWTKEYGKAIAGFSPHLEKNSIPCHYLWDSMSVYVDGTVPACCIDYEAESVMGNASNESVDRIWGGERFDAFRRAHLENRKSDMSPCNGCGYYSVWW